MPYRRRQDGINAGDRQDERESWRIIASMMGIIGILPMGGYKMYLLGILATLLIAIRALHLYDWLPVPPIDPANRNRGFNSFTDEEAYRDLRFHVYDLPKILRLLRIPVVLRVDNSKYVILILFIFVFHISFYTYISLHTYHYIHIITYISLHIYIRNCLFRGVWAVLTFVPVALSQYLGNATVYIW